MESPWLHLRSARAADLAEESRGQASEFRFRARTGAGPQIRFVRDKCLGSFVSLVASLADANQFKKGSRHRESRSTSQHRDALGAGKRVPSDAKLTDLLYLCQQSAAVGSDFTAPFTQIRERFLEIERELGVSAKIGEHLDKLASDIKKRCHARPRGVARRNTSMAS